MRERIIKKEKENLEQTDTKVKAGARHREQAAALVVEGSFLNMEAAAAFKSICGEKVVDHLWREGRWSRRRTGRRTDSGRPFLQREWGEYVGHSGMPRPAHGEPCPCIKTDGTPGRENTGESMRECATTDGMQRLRHRVER